MVARAATVHARESGCHKGVPYGCLHRRRWAVALALCGGVLLAGCATAPTLATFGLTDPPCYDRARQPNTPVVDSHVHFRPFGGPALPFQQVIRYLERSGVRFATVYGIGQMLPLTSECTYYLDCPGTPVAPTLKNDFINALELARAKPESVHLTLSMTFPDLERPAAVLAGMRVLDEEFPGFFRFMGEVNLVKQALFENGHRPVPIAAIGNWAPFMAVLRERNIPLAVHADLGNDENPTAYLRWIEEMLRLYPHNVIVWMHLGLSRELVAMDGRDHVAILRSILDRHPNAMLDISWRVIEDKIFSVGGRRPVYVRFLNAYSERILPGTDFVASARQELGDYRSTLDATSRILRELDDTAFRNIALGRNYFRMLKLDYDAPRVCSGSDKER